jgi:hypothetical protein
MEFVNDREIKINGMRGIYTGPLVDGMPNGHGTMKYGDAIYEGEWEKGKKTVGTTKWFDGDGKVSQEYDGPLTNGKPARLHGNNHMKEGGKTKRKRRRNKKNKRTKQNRKR